MCRCCFDRWCVVHCFYPLLSIVTILVFPPSSLQIIISFLLLSIGMALNTTLLRCVYCLRQIEDWLFFCLDCKDDFCSRCYISGFEFGHHRVEHEFRLTNLGTYPVFDSENYLTFSKESGDGTIAENGNGDVATSSKGPNKLELPKLKNSNKNIRDKVRKCLESNMHVVFNELASSDDANGYRRLWNVNDEKALLEAVLRFGIGNWREVATSLSQLLPGISEDEVQEHYTKHYVHGALGQFFWQSCLRLPMKSNFVSHVQDYPNDKMLELALLPTSLDKIPQQVFDQIGYLPKRDDFEKEFDHEAESLIGHISVNTSILDDDDAMKSRLKETQIKMYKERLLFRLRKKSIVRHYELVSMFAQYYFLYGPPDLDIQRLVRKHDLTVAASTKAGEPIFFKPFMRFCAKNDLSMFYYNLQKEVLLKMCCLFLTKCKLTGCKTIADIVAHAKKNRKFKRIVSVDSEAPPSKKICIAGENDRRTGRRAVAIANNNNNNSSSTSNHVNDIDQEINDIGEKFAKLFPSSNKAELLQQFNELLCEL